MQEQDILSFFSMAVLSRTNLEARSCPVQVFLATGQPRGALECGHRFPSPTAGSA
jgi:hypothetical protein